MAIEYDKIMWDTTKYVNPTNMNHMDDGIKAACDAVDNMEFNEKISWADYQALTPEEKRDGTIRFVTDYPNSATIIDDTVTTSTTRSWSAKKTNDEISAVNSNLSTLESNVAKYKTITTTTNQYGQITLDNAYDIVSLFVRKDRNFASWVDNRHIRVTDQTGNAVANTEITFVLGYL